MKLVVAVAIAASLALAHARITPVSVYSSGDDHIPGEYLVKFKESARAEFESFKMKRMEGVVEIHEFSDYMGFHAKLSKNQLKEVQQMAGLETIEPNLEVHALGEQTNVEAWGIDRVDQRSGRNNIYRWRDNAAGQGVKIYILDTGVLIEHVEFEGRAYFDADCSNATCNDGYLADENGHGTHCAGSAASRLYGVAKRAEIHSVRVLKGNGSGTVAHIIGGMQYVVNNGSGPRVISMSLGSSHSGIFNDAVDSVYRSGILSVIAAGNSNNNACNLSPAGAPTAFTVAATDQNDRKASFSSYGSCVDIWAPGVSILSTWRNGGSYLNSGTSMACPHVAGAAALVMSRGVTSPAEIKNVLINEATTDVVGNNPSGTPNRLLFTAP